VAGFIMLTLRFTAFTSESSEFTAFFLVWPILLRYLAGVGACFPGEQINMLTGLNRKIEHFLNGITQNDFADVLTENATLLSETTALKDRIQELEETLESMKARLDELCKEKRVSTIQDNPARKKRAMPQ
jgi:regulator of replication initiation timing